MIYDLKELREQLKSVMPQYVGNDEKMKTLVECFGFDALLAIAERLEALVEVKKPGLVELETASGSLCYINPQFVSDVCIINANYTNAGMVLVSTNTDSQFTVKGTLAEVMAKLRGEVTK